MAQSLPAGGRKIPTTPFSLNPLNDTLAFKRDPLKFVKELREKYGDIAQFRLMNMSVVFVNHPDYIKRILQENHLNYDRNAPIFRPATAFLGEGLSLIPDNKRWLKERRLMQPAFHKQRIAGFTALMNELTGNMLAQWETDYLQSGKELDLWDSMGQLTLSIVCKALLGTESSTIEDKVIPAFKQANDFIAEYMNMPIVPLKFPMPKHRAFWQVMKVLDEEVYSIINKRRQEQEEGNDLLGMLLSAVDDENEGLVDKQLRNEVITIMFAGHETTASTLSWIWYVLAQRPDLEQKLHEEVDQVLQGRIPTNDDLPALPYTRRLIDETLRYYPPAWQLFRRAASDDNLGDYHVPANSLIFLNPSLLHRHPDFWENPEDFDPDHFLPERAAQRYRHAYIPFSHGPRICIGFGFALTEAQVVVAMIAQKYRLKLASSPDIKPQPRMTLQPPEGGIKIMLERR